MKSKLSPPILLKMSYAQNGAWSDHWHSLSQQLTQPKCCFQTGCISLYWCRWRSLACNKLYHFCSSRECFGTKKLSISKDICKIQCLHMHPNKVCLRNFCGAVDLSQPNLVTYIIPTDACLSFTARLAVTWHSLSWNWSWVLPHLAKRSAWSSPPGLEMQWH